VPSGVDIDTVLIKKRAERRDRLFDDILDRCARRILNSASIVIVVVATAGGGSGGAGVVVVVVVVVSLGAATFEVGRCGPRSPVPVPLALCDLCIVPRRARIPRALFVEHGAVPTTIIVQVET
jgi:hypothetical protein